MFVDESIVYLKAGDGGDGCMSFRRERYIPKGGPNGGDGGRGGDVVLVGDRNTTDLTQYRFNHTWKARNGEPGRGRDQHGKNGVHCELKVPLGTVVLSEETGRVVCEVLDQGQKIVLLKGGSGGLGNTHFKTSTNQAPRETTPGKPGEQADFRLVLKTIADVGLVGFPNAGKSSLLTELTNATPKTAAYPFTTLSPQVGVMHDDTTGNSVVLADVPGLIEGASENRGLGHKFLRHIERCLVLLILLDMNGTDERDPAEDYRILLDELEAYCGTHKCQITMRPRLVVANKMDEPNAAGFLKKFKKQYPNVEILPLSILSDEGIPELKARLFEIVPHAREAAAEREQEKREARELDDDYIDSL